MRIKLIAVLLLLSGFVSAEVVCTRDYGDKIVSGPCWIKENGNYYSLEDLSSFTWIGGYDGAWVFNTTINGANYGFTVKPYFEYNNVNRTLANIKNIYPNINWHQLVRQNQGIFKWEFNLTDYTKQQQAIMQNTAIYLVVEDTWGLTWDDIQLLGGGQIQVKDVFIDYNDLKADGRHIELTGKRAVKITNINSLDFDPLITLQTAGTDNLRDAQVYEYLPAINLGTADNIKLNKDVSNWASYGIWRFNITQLTADKHVNGAYLDLYVNDAPAIGGDMQGKIFNVYNGYSWAENTITWNNRPIATTDYSTTRCGDWNISLNPTLNKRYNSTNLAGCVNTSIGWGNGYIDLYMVAAGSQSADNEYIQTASKEDATASKRPILYISYTAVSTTTTTTSTTTTTIETTTCLTPYGYRYTGTADPGSNHVRVNITSTYCVNTNCENAQVMNSIPYYRDGSYSFAVNTTINKTYTIYLGGFNYNFTTTAATPAIDEDVVLDISDFTLDSKAYWINWKNETDSQALKMRGMSSLQLKTFCDSYSPDTTDVKALNYPNLFLTTKERPVFEAIQDTQFNRKYQPYSDTETFSIFMPRNKTKYEEVDFELQDYTGTFGGSYLQIVTNVNDTLEKVWQSKWYHLQIPEVDLVNNTDYQYILYKDGNSRIITWDFVKAGGTKTIVVNTVDGVNTRTYDNRVSISTTSSYASNTVGVAYNSSIVLTSSRFQVYSQNSSYQYVKIYDLNTSTPTQIGTIDYTTPNSSNTYYVVFQVVGDGKTYEYANLVSPANSNKGPFYNLLNIPDGIFGYSGKQTTTVLSMFLISMVAMMFGAISVGFGMLATLAVVGATFALGLFPSMSWSLFGAMLALALIDKFTEGRKK